MKALLASALVGLIVTAAIAQDKPAAPAPLDQQKPNTWVKRSPLPGAPASPRLGYESSMDWDPFTQRLIRHGGHNQGGGGEQNFETWTLDPTTMTWQFMQPNTSPPGVCCERDNVFAQASRRFVRFPAFSNSHGWQWPRMINMRNWTAWQYDLPDNVWRNMRPLPQRTHGPGRGAVYDVHHDVVVLFSGQFDQSGKTSVYDPYTNTWHTMDPANSPPPRTYTGMAYDRANRKVVMFGAHYKDDPRTWLYDIRTNTWTDAKTENHPPSDRTAPVLAYDSLNKVVLAVMRTADKNGQQQTWVYDPAANTWKQMQPGGDDVGQSGHRNRLLVYVRDLNIFVLENRSGENEQPQQKIFTYRYAEAPKQVAPGQPKDVQVVTAADGSATLSWQPGPGPKPAGYRVLRGSGPTPWQAEFAPVNGGKLIAQTRLVDKLSGTTPTYYRVVAVDDKGNASDDSLMVRAQPRAMDHAVVSVIDAKQVEVSWKPASASDVVGYVVERADVEVYSTGEIVGNLYQLEKEGTPSPVGQVRKIGQFVPLTDKPIAATSFVDKTVDLTAKGRTVQGEPLYSNVSRKLDESGKPYRFAVYAYRLRAVNAAGVQSGPSPFFLTVPEAVENVWSKEDGKKVHLKWDARPEKGIQGYIVYRMDGKYDKRIERVSPELIKGTAWTDESAGEGKDNMHRYFVVAVDALGQEGIPSSPVWSYREWYRFYEPFDAGLGTWHQ